MNRISKTGLIEWENVHSIDDVYKWHKMYTPYFTDKFILEYLIPEYQKMDLENVPEKEISEFEELYLNSR